MLRVAQHELIHDIVPLYLAADEESAVFKPGSAQSERLLVIHYEHVQRAVHYLFVGGHPQGYAALICVYVNQLVRLKTAFRDALPPKAKKLTTVLGNVVVMIVFIRLLPIAMKFIGKNSKFLTSMMRIPFKYLYYSLPVGCVLTVVHLILKSILLFAPDTIEKA